MEYRCRVIDAGFPSLPCCEISGRSYSKFLASTVSRWHTVLDIVVGRGYRQIAEHVYWRSAMKTLRICSVTEQFDQTVARQV